VGAGVGVNPTVLPGLGIITAVAGENHLVLSGYVQVMNTAWGSGGIQAQCTYVVDGAPVGHGATNYFFPSAEGQVAMVARTAVSPGTHRIGVQCIAANVGVVADAGDYTIIATG
jgi:hypothetical protein